MEKEKIELGKIVKAVGIKGEVKLLSYSDDPYRYERLKNLIVGNMESTVKSVRVKDRQPIIKLEGIDDRNKAEELVGVSVFMWAEDLEKLPKGQYYIRDLIGAFVFDKKLGYIGKVEEVYTDRPQQLYKLSSEEHGEVYFPWVKDFILSVDVEKKEINVDLPEGILDV